MIYATNDMTAIAIPAVEAGSQSSRRSASGSNGDNDIYLNGPAGFNPSPGSAPRPSNLTLLNIMNHIFRTKCQDAQAIDATAAWEVIIDELKPCEKIIPTLAIRYQMGMTRKEAGRILGLPGHEIQERCFQALNKLRHPCRLRRIRNSIMGWPNLYREN